MPAEAINLLDFALAMPPLPEDLHPAGAATLAGWKTELLQAADHGDAQEVARLARAIDGKLALERAWYPPDGNDDETR